MKYYWEQGSLDEKWIRHYCKGNWEDCKRFQKEERGEFHQDNMLPDGEIDDKLE